MSELFYESRIRMEKALRKFDKFSSNLDFETEAESFMKPNNTSKALQEIEL